MKSKLVVLGKSFLITVMTIQIIFGMVYFFLHWNNTSAYYETSEILSIAESGVYDEYTDFLYPVLIRGYLQIQQLFSLSSFAFVYSVQAIIFIFSVFKLLGQLHFLRRNYIYHHLILRIFLSFYIFSFPIILQMVMSILPNILSLSIVLLVIGIIWGEKNVLFLNEYFYFLLCFLASSSVSFIWFYKHPEVGAIYKRAKK